MLSLCSSVGHVQVFKQWSLLPVQRHELINLVRPHSTKFVTHAVLMTGASLSFLFTSACTLLVSSVTRTGEYHRDPTHGHRKAGECYVLFWPGQLVRGVINHKFVETAPVTQLSSFVTRSWVIKRRQKAISYERLSVMILLSIWNMVVFRGSDTIHTVVHSFALKVSSNNSPMTLSSWHLKVD